MKVLKWIGLIVLFVIVILFVISLFLPSSFRFEAKTEIKTPASSAYKLVADLNSWSKWDPWCEADTALTEVITGDPGIGQKRVWKSKTQGNGELTILEVVENKQIKGELLFENSKKPSYDNWTFEEKDGITAVTWVVEGETGFNPIVKYVILLNKKMMQKFLTKGLENLSALAIATAKEQTPKFQFIEKEIPAGKYLSVRKTIKMDEIKEFMGQSYGAIMAFLAKNKLQPAGYPIALYHTWKPEESIVEVEAAIPVAADFKLIPPKEINLIEIPAGKVISAIHYGAYEKIGVVWEGLEKVIKDNKYEINGSPWESYITDPMAEPDTNKWQTEVIYPIK